MSKRRAPIKALLWLAPALLFAYGFTFNVGAFWTQPVPVAPFSPDSIPNMTLWLEADNPSTLFQNSDGATNPVTANGQIVGSWVNRITGTDYCKDMGATDEPTYAATGLNGLPAIDFTGTNACKTTGSWDSYITGATDTIFVVAVVDLAPTDIGTFTPQTGPAILAGDNNPSIGFTIDNSPMTLKLYNYSGSYGWSSPGFSLNTPFVAKARHSGGAWSGNIGTGNLTGGAASGATSNASEGMLLGVNHTKAFFFDGRIAAVYVYNRDLSNAEILTVAIFLTSKYGL